MEKLFINTNEDLISLLTHADGGCPYCVSKLLVKLITGHSLNKEDVLKITENVLIQNPRGDLEINDLRKKVDMSIKRFS